MKYVCSNFKPTVFNRVVYLEKKKIPYLLNESILKISI